VGPSFPRCLTAAIIRPNLRLSPTLEGHLIRAFFPYFQVSWVKRHGDTPHLLTFGLNTYSSDGRFQVYHEPPNDWKLQIQFPSEDDEGLYECQVASNPPLLRRIRLSVVGELPYVGTYDPCLSLFLRRMCL